MGVGIREKRRPPLRHRIPITVTLDPDLYAEAAILAELDGGPISRLIDLALLRLLVARGRVLPPRLAGG